MISRFDYIIDVGTIIAKWMTWLPPLVDGSAGFGLHMFRPWPGWWDMEQVCIFLVWIIVHTNQEH